jgi:hypothetical protein
MNGDHRLRFPRHAPRRRRPVGSRKKDPAQKIRPTLAVMQSGAKKIRPTLAVMQSGAKLIQRFW